MQTTTTQTRRKPVRPLLYMVAVLASVLQAGAAMMTWDFEWTVTEAVPFTLTGDFLYWGPVSVGDHFTGTLSYDPTVQRHFVGGVDLFRPLDPVEEKFHLAFSSSPAASFQGVIILLRIQNSPSGGFLDFNGEAVASHWMGINFEAPPGKTISEDFLPSDLNVSDWSRVTAFFEFGGGGGLGHIEGEVTSITQHVPEGGSTAVMLLMACAAFCLAPRSWQVGGRAGTWRWSGEGFN